MMSAKIQVFLSISVLLTLAQCKSSDDCCIEGSEPFYPLKISLFDSLDNDLLNIETPNYYKGQEIDLYAYDSLDTKVTYQFDYGNPVSDETIGQFGLSINPDHAINTFYLKLSNSDTDTIKVMWDENWPEEVDMFYYNKKLYDYKTEELAKVIKYTR
jgi:hypothetical protein